MRLKNEDLNKALEIKQFLETHYQEHYDYDYLVHKFGMNKFKLKFAFKAVSNDNVHSYITKLRIEKAKEMLESTDRTIGFIADKVGLDKSNFYIQFKKLTGQTPSEWRNSKSTNSFSNYRYESV
ncbi:helix-turn-helix domain-containing protein [Niastella sp. OAS944]|uniref:helix-turn-helix domain-containing protein n=1 Tax=Niastella sp. OAS944 TaxID=2664089 RepID=UPI003469E4F3|nr:AraC-like DNA-binding protein [Chitinophagaceae bacterium OAS944]